MFATIWMCTQEWSLISMRATAFTLETCHQAFSCLSAFTRSTTERSLRLPRTGTLMRMRSIASEGVSRTSRSASSGMGWSILSAVSLSSAMARSLFRLFGALLVPDGRPRLRARHRQDRPLRFGEPVVEDGQHVGFVRNRDGSRERSADPGSEEAGKEAEHRANEDGDDVRDHHEREHATGLAPDELGRAPERIPRAPALDHHERHDERPSRDCDEAGDDQEDEAD